MTFGSSRNYFPFKCIMFMIKYVAFTLLLLHSLLSVFHSLFLILPPSIPLSFSLFLFLSFSLFLSVGCQWLHLHDSTNGSEISRLENFNGLNCHYEKCLSSFLLLLLSLFSLD